MDTVLIICAFLMGAVSLTGIVYSLLIMPSIQPINTISLIVFTISLLASIKLSEMGLERKEGKK